MPPETTDQARWFAEEVHAHNSQLKSYLCRSFPDVRDVDDIVQESYVRVWKARARQPIRSIKSFLFQVARHLAIDRVRRDQVSPFAAVGDLARLPVMDDGPGVAESVSVREKARILTEVIASLPPRCREIVMLRKLQCLSQREVATRLGIAEKTVDEHLARGVRRLEAHLRRRGVDGLYEP